VTIKYPAVHLGRGARADILSVAFAGSRQHQDATCEMDVTAGGSVPYRARLHGLWSQVNPVKRPERAVHWPRHTNAACRPSTTAWRTLSSTSQMSNGFCITLCTDR
jgi:hypothetical protein